MVWKTRKLERRGAGLHGTVTGIVVFPGETRGHSGRLGNGENRLRGWSTATCRALRGPQTHKTFPQVEAPWPRAQVNLTWVWKLLLVPSPTSHWLFLAVMICKQFHINNNMGVWESNMDLRDGMECPPKALKGFLKSGFHFSAERDWDKAKSSSYHLHNRWLAPRASFVPNTILWVSQELSHLNSFKTTQWDIVTLSASQDES